MKCTTLPSLCALSARPSGQDAERVEVHRTVAGDRKEGVVRGDAVRIAVGWHLPMVRGQAVRQVRRVPADAKKAGTSGPSVLALPKCRTVSGSERNASPLDFIPKPQPSRLDRHAYSENEQVSHGQKEQGHDQPERDFEY